MGRQQPRDCVQPPNPVPSEMDYGQPTLFEEVLWT